MSETNDASNAPVKRPARRRTGSKGAPAAPTPAAAEAEKTGGAAAIKGRKARAAKPEKRGRGAKALDNVSKTDLELLEWLETQDPIRKHAIRSLFTRSLFLALLTGGIGGAYAWQVSVMANPLMSAGVFVGLAVVFIGGLVLYAYEPIRSFRSRIKRKIIPELACRHGLTYDPDTTNASPSSAFEKQGLAPFHDRSVVDDVFSGEVKGCAVTLIEGRLQVKSWKGWADVFNGLFIDVATPTNVAHPVLVTDAVNAAMQRRRKVDQYDLKETALSEEAKTRFALYAEQIRDARIIAETKFLDSLLSLEALLHGVRIQAIVEPKRVLLLVRTNFNFFELGSVRRTLAQPETLRHFREDLAIFEDVVTTLRSSLPEKGRGPGAAVRLD